MKTCMKNQCQVLIGALVFALAAATFAAPYVILKNDVRIDGTAIRATASGDIVITTAQGMQTIPKGDYKQAFADKPAEMDVAAQKIQAKQYDEALKLLEDIAVKFRSLGWDVKARMLIPRVNMEKGEFEAALANYDKLFALAPAAREDAEAQWGYRQALMGAKQYTKLEQQLEQVTATGSRADAARAQILRGDARMAQGQLDLAILDYLRTAVLFKDVKECQPEALYKAGEALEKNRDPRAKDFYKTLVQEYGGTPYAAKAQGKI